MQERQATSALFTQVDISAATHTVAASAVEMDQVRLLREILKAQDRQNELLEEMLNHISAGQKQRAQEMQQWKAANADLADRCRQASESLVKVQADFLRTIAFEVNENGDSFEDGEYMLHEFLDKYGPRLVHLNGVIQVLSQLSGPAPTV